MTVFGDLEWASLPELPPHLSRSLAFFSEISSNPTLDETEKVLTRFGISDPERVEWYYRLFVDLAAVDLEEQARSMDPEFREKETKK